MVQALRRGEVDYVRGVGADQFDALGSEPNIKPVEGFANGYTYLSFNTKGNTEGYGGSTSALIDPKFRDALGYAIDNAKLVDATLAGHGVPGDHECAALSRELPRRSRPTPRRFDIAEADRRLVAAGYAKDAAGKRLDKDGKVINLRLTWPDSEAENATNAQFIQGWFAELGIGVEAAVTEEGKLMRRSHSVHPTGRPTGTSTCGAGSATRIRCRCCPSSRSGALGGTNDSFFTNERYDELFALQQKATDENQRKAYIAEMQQIFYDNAPYIVLYYDSELHAYRTDKFGGWVNQPPDTGTPLFGYGPIGYTLLTLATAASPSPSAGASASAAPSGAVATPAPVRQRVGRQPPAAAHRSSSGPGSC